MNAFAKIAAALATFLFTGAIASADDKPTKENQSECDYFQGSINSITASAHGPVANLVSFNMQGIGTQNPAWDSMNFSIVNEGAVEATMAKIAIVANGVGKDSKSFPLRVTYYHANDSLIFYAHIVDAGKGMGLPPDKKCSDKTIPKRHRK